MIGMLLAEMLVGYNYLNWFLLLYKLGNFNNGMLKNDI
jgi:hypothetical protein